MTSTTTEGWTIHWARLYDLVTSLDGGRARALQEDLLGRATIRAGERVLDVGCGPGRLTLAAARAAGPTGETLGIDAAPEMVALATRKAARAGSSARFREGAIESLPVPDDHFDVALASMMIHHLTPELQRRGVAEVRRALAPGGRFLIVETAATPGHGVGHLLAIFGLRRGNQHAEMLRALLRDAGFEAITVEPAAARGLVVLQARKPQVRRK